MACIHYKFNAQVDYKTLIFDGLNIAVIDLKREITTRESIGKDFDLRLTNAQTKREYCGDTELVPRNSSIIVRRVPAIGQGRAPKLQNRHNDAATATTSAVTAEPSKQSLLSSGLSEVDALSKVKAGVKSTYGRENYASRGHFNKPPPPTYVCDRCKQTGHWVKQCPMAQIRKAAGRMNSELEETSADHPNAFLHSSGKYVVPKIDLVAKAAGKKEARPFIDDHLVQPISVQPVRKPPPVELQCPLCKELLKECVMMSCCGWSCCDDCIRNHMLENGPTCPGCRAKDIGPDRITPSQLIRKLVKKHLAESGAQQLSAVGVDAQHTAQDSILAAARANIEKGSAKAANSGLPSVLQSLMNSQTTDPPTRLPTVTIGAPIALNVPPPVIQLNVPPPHIPGQYTSNDMSLPPPMYGSGIDQPLSVNRASSGETPPPGVERGQMTGSAPVMTVPPPVVHRQEVMPTSYSQGAAGMAMHAPGTLPPVPGMSLPMPPGVLDTMPMYARAPPPVNPSHHRVDEWDAFIRKKDNRRRETHGQQRRQPSRDRRRSVSETSSSASDRSRSPRHHRRHRRRHDDHRRHGTDHRSDRHDSPSSHRSRASDDRRKRDDSRTRRSHKPEEKADHLLESTPSENPQPTLPKPMDTLHSDIPDDPLIVKSSHTRPSSQSKESIEQQNTRAQHASSGTVEAVAVGAAQAHPPLAKPPAEAKVHSSSSKTEVKMEKEKSRERRKSGEKKERRRSSDKKDSKDSRRSKDASSKSKTSSSIKSRLSDKPSSASAAKSEVKPSSEVAPPPPSKWDNDRPLPDDELKTPTVDAKAASDVKASSSATKTTSKPSPRDSSKSRRHSRSPKRRTGSSSTPADRSSRRDRRSRSRSKDRSKESKRDSEKKVTSSSSKSSSSVRKSAPSTKEIEAESKRKANELERAHASKFKPATSAVTLVVASVTSPVIKAPTVDAKTAAIFKVADELTATLGNGEKKKHKKKEKKEHKKKHKHHKSKKSKKGEEGDKKSVVDSDDGGVVVATASQSKRQVFVNESKGDSSKSSTVAKPPCSARIGEKRRLSGNMAKKENFKITCLASESPPKPLLAPSKRSLKSRLAMDAEPPRKASKSSSFSMKVASSSRVVKSDK